MSDRRRHPRHLVESGWHLEKRVPIALIVAIVFQTFALLVGGGYVLKDISYLKEEVVGLKGIGTKVAILEVQMATVIKQNDELKRLLERRTAQR